MDCVSVGFVPPSLYPSLSLCDNCIFDSKRTSLPVARIHTVSLSSVRCDALRCAVGRDVQFPLFFCATAPRVMRGIASFSPSAGVPLLGERRFAHFTCARACARSLSAAVGPAHSLTVSFSFCCSLAQFSVFRPLLLFPLCFSTLFFFSRLRFVPPSSAEERSNQRTRLLAVLCIHTALNVPLPLPSAAPLSSIPFSLRFALCCCCCCPPLDPARRRTTTRCVWFLSVCCVLLD
jgi:hypothetical protein